MKGGGSASSTKGKRGVIVFTQLGSNFLSIDNKGRYEKVSCAATQPKVLYFVKRYIFNI